MSAGHTPGPWVVSKRASRRVTSAQGVVICNAVLRNTGPWKGGIKNGAKDVVEAEANARLIAAAPDLLETLELFARLKFPANAEGNAGFYSIPFKRIEAARAAIAKATGQEGGAL